MPAKKLILLFPGQGSQAVTMGRELSLAYSSAKEVFQEVDDALNLRLSKIIFEGPPETLNETENTQPALLACSIAVARTIERQMKTPLAAIADCAAGHSLGEYSALTALGAVRLADAARLLKLRGMAMQSAVPKGEGGMSAVLGLGYAEVVEAASSGAELARRQSIDSTKAKVCVAANDNAEGQVVLSGHIAALECAEEYAREAGAKRVIRLAVSAPFHSPLMQPAVEVLKPALEDTSLEPLPVPVVANVSATLVQDIVRFRSLLAEQLTAPVRWRETMEVLAEREAFAVAEIGPGKVLCGLAKRGMPNHTAYPVATPQDIERLIEAIV